MLYYANPYFFPLFFTGITTCIEVKEYTSSWNKGALNHLFVSWDCNNLASAAATYADGYKMYAVVSASGEQTDYTDKNYLMPQHWQNCKRRTDYQFLVHAGFGCAKWQLLCWGQALVRRCVIGFKRKQMAWEFIFPLLENNKYVHSSRLWCFRAWNLTNGMEEKNKHMRYSETDFQFCFLYSVDNFLLTCLWFI